MVMMRRVRTVWSGVAGSPYYTNMYFTFVQDQAVAAGTAVDLFWDALKAGIDTGVTARVEAEQAIVDDATGDTVDTETSGVAFETFGEDPGDPMPGFTQGLVRWQTATFVGGRRIKGRTFIPAVTEGSNQNGVPVAGYVDRFPDAIGDLIDSSSSFGPLRIFSRTNLTSAVVISGSLAPSWSVLRSRRY